MHDELVLTVIIRHVDLDEPAKDAEEIRAQIEHGLGEAGWDAEVTIDATLLNEG